MQDGNPGSCQGQGADAKQPVDPLQGRRLGHFKLEELRGHGGFASVYMATHVDLKTLFAVKVLKGEHVRDPEARERLRREAWALGELRHSNCVSLADYGEDEEAGLYLVMEYLTGRTLQEEFQAIGKLPLERIRDVFGQICLILQHAHTLGILHRDMKPDNIYLVTNETQTDVVKVFDFGIALMTESDMDRLTRDGYALGTGKYVAPEQASGEGGDIDGRADLYSLGAMLFEMLTGRAPFEAANAALLFAEHVYEPAPTLRQRAPDRKWHPELEKFVAMTLAKKPTERPRDAAEFRSLLDEAIAAQEELEGAAVAGPEEGAGAVAWEVREDPARPVGAAGAVGGEETELVATEPVGKGQRKGSPWPSPVVGVGLVVLGLMLGAVGFKLIQGLI